MERENRILYLPKGLETREEMGRALEFIGLSPIGNSIEMVGGHPPERR